MPFSRFVDEEETVAGAGECQSDAEQTQRAFPETFQRHGASIAPEFDNSPSLGSQPTT